MLFREPKNAGRRSITALVVFGLVFLLSAAFAAAVCGPEFNNKKEAISFIKSEPAVADALADWMSKHKKYGYHADQDVIGALEQNAKAFKAPRGYKLTHNTACGSGPGHYEKYGGLLNNMGGRLMLWYGNKKGEYFPLLKGYCFNAVFGPPVTKKPPVKSPPCKKKCKKKPKKKCSVKSGHANGNCIKQTNTAEQNCEAGTIWNGTQCTIVQVNAVCSNVAIGNEGNVNQGGNCNTGGQETCVGQNNCNTTPPCTTSCHPPEEPEEPPKTPEPPKVEWERIQEMFTDHERKLCVTVTPATGVEVQFAVKWGARSNGGKGVYNASTNKYCVIYTSPSEEPPDVCQEPISTKLPPGTKCDTANVAVFSSNGAKTVTGKMEIPILEEEKAVVW